MKALTLTQPWATLVAIGAKRVETRSWSTSYRGPLAIHAAKALPWSWSEFNPTREPAFAEALGDLAPLNNYGSPDLACLPRGVVVATCDLIDVVQIDAYLRVQLSEAELAFGDYSDGRLAWLLANVKQLDEPVPAKGRLGLWEWEPIRA
jgi:activating signal cointegrator 1